jgi:DNA-binding NarL/FixJ family response regulator
VIRAVVADDEALVRSGVRMILEAQEDLEVVAEAADGADALDAVARLDPDVVLMDVRMPRLDGIEATRRIAAARSDTRVLMLTTFDHDELVYDAMRAGASGFLLKSAPPEQLTAAVRTVVAGESLLAPVITRRLIEAFTRGPRPGEQPAALAELTDRECEVLRLIAHGRSNREIARELFLSEGTVKTHINRIFRKLDLRDRVQAVVLAYESGLVRLGDG